jgi:hypothetical protein
MNKKKMNKEQEKQEEQKQEESSSKNDIDLEASENKIIDIPVDETNINRTVNEDDVTKGVVILVCIILVSGLISIGPLLLYFSMNEKDSYKAIQMNFASYFFNVTLGFLIVYLLSVIIRKCFTICFPIKDSILHESVPVYVTILVTASVVAGPFLVYYGRKPCDNCKFADEGMFAFGIILVIFPVLCVFVSVLYLISFICCFMYKFTINHWRLFLVSTH